MSSNLKFTVNNLEYQAPAGLLLIEALARNNIEMPRLCYLEDLAIAGNCRLCLIEVSGNPKAVASCAVNIGPNMHVYTNTKIVKLAREHSLELTLINHPLDCPICDQGGECDLQDQTMVFGGDRGRFYEFKRAVEDEFISPIIKVLLTRCIHCTRCVRFFEQMSGIPYLGMIDRGSNMQISTFIRANVIDFEMSGNAIDICPVGALTFKPNAFEGRCWEYESGYTIDCFDTFCTDIRIDYKNNKKIMRILPNPNARNSFISDKTRLTYDILNYKMRYDAPYELFGTINLYRKRTWIELIEYLTGLLWHNKRKIIGIGDFLDLNTLLSLKNLIYYTTKNNNTFVISTLGLFKDSVNTNLYLHNNDLFTNVLYALEKSLLNTLLLININFRLEMPVLNAKIRRFQAKQSQLDINILGDALILKYNFDYNHLGICSKDVYKIVKGNHWICHRFVDYVFNNNTELKINLIGYGIMNLYKNSILLYGLLKDNINLINYVNKKTYTIVNIIHTNMSLINACFLNLFFRPKDSSIINTTRLSKTAFHPYNHYFSYFYYSLNEDIINKKGANYSQLKTKKYFKIYQGLYVEIYKDQWYKNKFNIIIPVKNLFEYDSVTFSFEGQIKNFIKIFNNINFFSHSNILGFLLQGYLNRYFNEINFYKRIKINLKAVDNNFTNFNYKIISEFYDENFFKINNISYDKIFILNFKEINIWNKLFILSCVATEQKINYTIFNHLYTYYHHSDFISKLSKLMNKCYNLFKKETSFSAY